jgi:hypothetical protein
MGDKKHKLDEPYFSAIWFLGDGENRDVERERELKWGWWSVHYRGPRLNSDHRWRGNANRCDHFSHGRSESQMIQRSRDSKWRCLSSGPTPRTGDRTSQVGCRV